MQDVGDILQLLRQRFPDEVFQQQHTVDEILTLWVSKNTIVSVIRYLKSNNHNSYPLLYDLCGIDERDRAKRKGGR